MQYVYVMKGMSKMFPGGREILKNIWLSFIPGAKIGIVGQNGSGKSTLMKIMGGIDKEFNGEAWASKEARVGYLQQEPQLDPSKNVMDNVKDGLAHIRDAIAAYETINLKFCEPMSDEEMASLIDEQAKLQEQIDHCDAWDFDRKIEMAMEALRCPDGNASVENLSGGEKRRVALCRLLLACPDLLILDEPTNHLDAESVAWLERHLQNYAGTVVLVTHDRYFLDNIASWILEIERGQCIPFEGNYSSWLEQKNKRLLTEQKQEDELQKKLAHELEWVRSSPKGRQSKSKSRLNSYEELLKQSMEPGRGEGGIMIPPGPRLGQIVIEAKNLAKGFEDKLLFENVTFSIPPAAIVGVIGANGAGKTTLSKILTGQDTPDSGSIKVGETVTMSYVDQSRDLLDPNKTIWEEISGGVDELILGKRKISSRAYCGLFNFKGSDQQKKISLLSGGERNRVHLAKILKSNANVLLLDEPTNDLDVETLRSLEDALLEFAGCAIVISHDRWFLDRIATHILAFEGNSQVAWFEGNYQSYEEDRKKRLGSEFFQPQRIKYKKLVK